MFLHAKAITADLGKGKDRLNRHLVFKETLDSVLGVRIKIAAADYYRLTVNGHFVGFGPARAAKGVFRIDEYDLSEYDNGTVATVIIELAAYGCSSLSLPKQESFLAAELCKGEQVLKYTGKDFRAYDNKTRIRAVERLSLQRHFTEVYDLGSSNVFDDENELKLILANEERRFIERGVPYPSYAPEYTLKTIHSHGSFEEGDTSSCPKPAYFTYDRSWGYFEDEEIHRSNHRFISAAKINTDGFSGVLPKKLVTGQWLRVDFEHIETGFIHVIAEADEASEIIVAHSELSGEGFSFVKINMQQVAEYRLPKGYSLDDFSFEPYSFKTVAVFVISGSVTVKEIGVRGFVRDTLGIKRPTFRHPELSEIFDAAVRSFSHNAVDLYTDCPSRERAGWLCDSYFSAKAEYFLYGKSSIEDAFLENYRDFKFDGGIPNGALPMCYPANYGNGGGFIPQWNIWYILEVFEYLTERGHMDMLDDFKASVFGVLDFLREHENEMGLLERLPGWNFIEWSDANKWARDINYPTNFLYGAALKRVGNVYSMPSLTEKGERIIRLTESLSFNGEIFIDNAIKDEKGGYRNTKNASEAGQYYAAIFGELDLESEKYSKLKMRIINGFKDHFSEDVNFCRINAFIGLYLRIMLLYNMNEVGALYRTITEFCSSNVKKTGTLWEDRETKHSLNHGFASYIATTLQIADGYSED